MMDEFSFIDSIKQNTYKQSSLIKGVGDDAAVFRSDSKDIVTAVDTFVEGIHFTRKTMDPYHVGYRALGANVSDLAAMGATPAFYLVSIVIPKNWAIEDISQIFIGMKDLANQHTMDLIGGDTVSGIELSISITVIGFVEEEKARYRSTAKEGDLVFVTGTLGDSQAGLYILMNEGNYEDTNYYVERHRMPSPRIDFAKKLSYLSRVTLNDISDGIGNEANEIAEASEVTIIIQDELVPVHSSYYQFSPELQHKWKYYGGEDFELIGTVPESEWETVQHIADQTNTMVTQIGYVSSDKGNDVFLYRNQQKEQLKKKGYNHLK
ncbi:thiamine-phosphate kinase [Oceanobacillus bengalensis]